MSLMRGVHPCFVLPAYRIQYLPGVETPQEDIGTLPATPSGLAASGNIGTIAITATVTRLQENDFLEIYAAATNDRTGATRVFLGKATEFTHALPTGSVRYYWCRVRRQDPGIDLFSGWLPTSATGGVVGQASLAGTDDIEPGAATAIFETVVNSETYNFPLSFGVLDRNFTALLAENTTSETVGVEVTVTGQRSITTPSGLSGTVDGRAWVPVINETASLLVATTQDYMVDQLVDVPASTTRSFIESTAFVTEIPAGHTFSFTPKFRVNPLVGSTGNISLTTTAYTCRVTLVKR